MNFSPSATTRANVEKTGTVQDLITSKNHEVRIYKYLILLRADEKKKY